MYTFLLEATRTRQAINNIVHVYSTGIRKMTTYLLYERCTFTRSLLLSANRRPVSLSDGPELVCVRRRCWVEAASACSESRKVPAIRPNPTAHSLFLHFKCNVFLIEIRRTRPHPTPCNRPCNDQPNPPRTLFSYMAYATNRPPLAYPHLYHASHSHTHTSLFPFELVFEKLPGFVGFIFFFWNRGQ